MPAQRSPAYYLLIAVVAFVSILVFEAAFYDEISWLTVILSPVAVLIGLVIGDGLRARRT